MKFICFGKHLKNIYCRKEEIFVINNNSNNVYISNNSSNNNGKLKIIPLGGLHEVGKNITVFEYENDIFVLDAGLAFPEDDMLGVDLVIPDISYLEKNKEKRYRADCKHDFLFSGILRCAECGSYMRPKLKTNYTADGELRFDYMCELKEKSRKQSECC